MDEVLGAYVTSPEEGDHAQCEQTGIGVWEASAQVCSAEGWHSVLLDSPHSPHVSEKDRVTSKFPSDQIQTCFGVYSTNNTIT
eukprot:4884860-Amphidinium_carterae.1